MKAHALLIACAALAGCASPPRTPVDAVPRTSVVRDLTHDCAHEDADQPGTARTAAITRDPAAGERYLRRNMRCAR